MRASLLIVALMAMVALASAQTSTFGLLKGTLYTDNACSAGSNAVSLQGSLTLTTPCQTVSGSGSTANVVTGVCYSYSYSGITESYWYITQYTAGATCTVSTGAVTGGTVNGYAYDGPSATNLFPDSMANGAFKYGTGCFVATSCSNGASTLVVPSILLVALAFAARKLSL